jgi:BTB/POZ domain
LEIPEVILSPVGWSERQSSEMTLVIDDKEIDFNFTISNQFDVRLNIFCESVLDKKFEARFGIVNKNKDYTWNTNAASNLLQSSSAVLIFYDKLEARCFNNALKCDKNWITVACNVKFAPLNETIEGNFCENLWKNFEKLRTDESLADVTLHCADKKSIKAHKFILISKSRVFMKMFQMNMMESHQNQVMIPDIASSVIELLLKFMHGNLCCVIFDENIFDLLIAADKYEVLDLKEICETKIMEHINPDTVSEILILADRHDAVRMKQKAIEYFRKFVYFSLNFNFF